MEYYEYNDGEIWKMEDESITEYCFKCAESWFAYSQVAIQNARDNIKFIYVDQWDDHTRSDRRLANKPSYSNNIIMPIERKLVAEQRYAQPSINAIPAGPDVPKELIELNEGLFESVSYASNARQVYAKCFSDQLDAGWGALLVDEEQESEDSIHKVLKFPYIMDILRCGWDPAAQTPNKTDGDFCFIYTVMSKKEFFRKYPDLKDRASSEGLSNSFFPEYMDKNSIVLLNFWCREYYTEEMLLLDNGTQLSSKKFNKLHADAIEADKENKARLAVLHEKLRAAGMPEEMLPQFEPEYIPEIIKRKKITKSRLLQFLVTRHHVLERRKFDPQIKKLPLVYVPGQTQTIDGKVMPITFAGVAHTAQKGVNYCFSEIMNGISKTFTPKIIATEAMVAAHSNIANNPDISQTFIWDPDPNAPGQRPDIISPPPFSPALLEVMRQCQADVRATLGRNDETMGDQSNTTSGIGINYRQFAGDLSMGSYPDNLTDGIGELARCTLERFPTTYAGERSIMIRGKDGKMDYKNINSPMYEMDEQGAMMLENDLSKGKFEIEVTGGANFISQKFAVIELLMQYARLDPMQLGPLVYDFIAKLYPIADANTLVHRVRSMVTPPQVIAEEAGEKPKPQPPSPKDVAMEMESKADLINAVAKVIAAKNAAKELELESQTKEKQLEQDAQKAKLEFVETVMDMKTRNLESFAEMETAAINAQDRQAEREGKMAIEAFKAENQLFTELIKLD